jgi:hypothetical protein
VSSPDRSDGADRDGATDRRTVLALGVAGLSVTTAGCVIAPRASDRETATPSNETSTPSTTPLATSTPRLDPIQIVVSNDRDAAVDVTLTVTSEGTTVFEDTVTVAPDDRRSVDPGIDATGAYELTVALADGTERARPFGVEVYDLRMGSNLVVAVGERVRVVMEE